MFQRHRIPFLWHNRGNLYKPVRDINLRHFKAGPGDQILHQPAKMDAPKPDGAIACRDIVNIRDRSIGILDNAREAEQVSDALAIKVKARSGDCRRAHRAVIHLFQSGVDSGHVAQHEFNRGPKIMPEDRNLRRLSMRVEQHDLIDASFSARQKLVRQRAILLEKSQQSETQLHPEHRMLHVIARSSGMKPPGRLLANLPTKFLFDQKEKILKTAIEWLIRPWTVLVNSDQ